MQTQTFQRTFSYFPNLTDDLKLNILSYVADAPYEALHNKNVAQSTLTHFLPRVSRKLRDLANLNLLWKDAVVRQVINEPTLWRVALERILELSTNAKTDSDDQEAEAEALVFAAFEKQKYVDFKAMYGDVLSRYLRFVGPVFCMGGQVNIGEAYGLHFFEPRYRLLIAEVMKYQPETAKRGGPIVGNDCLFIHANRGPLAPTTPATLVKVIKCDIFRDGRADVELLPVAYVWLEKLWSQGNSGNLHFAQCFKMGHVATKSMNQLARQEQLAYIMSHLADHWGGDGGSGSGSSSGVSSGED
mmetsp:Transcript_12206/g.15957  ORF Transcript_12206/g.15957 Transcript_12206/m.15957 type:complete len:301 (+) Transcript_12206:149-1051(+)|eukprot:CAMPEP_0198140224 /NCGR_PEP_ID=MMETSP1443-20131203/3426_1 /TAXON_ID=186043 /ORGANISM="Entomoneis sp., Strain CCMP2396" /LENGTH=300 /DNA_ID=CAMNT_0043802587 /DNA_START=73 /DNA_END=975 /DNA_ORIENTATION=-